VRYFKLLAPTTVIRCIEYRIGSIRKELNVKRKKELLYINKDSSYFHPYSRHFIAPPIYESTAN
jgi:hypothetical protein